MGFWVEWVERLAERRTRVPSEYMGRLGRASGAALWKFLLLQPASSHRSALAKELLSKPVSSADTVVQL